MLPSLSGAFADALYEEAKQVSIKSSAAETTLETPDGYVHKFVRVAAGLHLIAQFQYSPVESKEPGALPSLSYTPQTFHASMEVVMSRVRMMLKGLQSVTNLSIKKLGLLAQTELTEAQLPPGGVQFRNWLQSPWKEENASVVKSNGTLLVRWNDTTSKFRDQCHHSLNFDTDENPSELGLMLDYQRVWNEGFAVSQANVEIETFKKRALEYFQDFAFGDRKWPA